MGRMARGESFLKRLCPLLGRDPIPRKPGRKPQAVADKEKYVLCPPICRARQLLALGLRNRLMGKEVPC